MQYWTAANNLEKFTRHMIENKNDLFFEDFFKYKLEFKHHNEYQINMVFTVVFFAFSVLISLSYVG